MPCASHLEDQRKVRVDCSAFERSVAIPIDRQPVRTSGPHRHVTSIFWESGAASNTANSTQQTCLGHSKRRYRSRRGRRRHSRLAAPGRLALSNWFRPPANHRSRASSTGKDGAFMRLPHDFTTPSFYSTGHLCKRRVNTVHATETPPIATLFSARKPEEVLRRRITLAAARRSRARPFRRSSFGAPAAASTTFCR